MRCLCQLNHEVCRVLKLLEMAVQMLGKVVADLRRGPLINLIAVIQEDQPINAVEQLGRWLVNCTNNGHVILDGLLLEDLNDLECCLAVEAACWLIEKKKNWISNELVSDTCSFALPSRETFEEDASNARSPTVLKAEPLNDLINFLLNTSCIQVGSQFCSELKALLRRESLQQNIILLHKSAKLSKITLFYLSLVTTDNSRELGAFAELLDSLSKYIE